MFNKKFLTVMAALFVSVSLLLIGCGDAGEAGAAGKDGSNGPSGGMELSGTVTAAELAAAFELTGNVLLKDGANVSGVIPEGATLVVTGSAKVTADAFLDVQDGGTLDIKTGAVLDASYVSTASGYVKGTGTVKGAGTVKLPYFGSSATKPAADVLSFTDSLTGLVKIAGSYNDSAAAGTALDVAGVKTLFGLDGGPDALIAEGLTGIDAATVPTDKELTLTGTGNTVTANLDLSSAGTLVVAEGAVLAVTGGAYTITAVPSGTSNVTIDGTLDLTNNAGATVAGLVTNNGKVLSKGTTKAIQKALVTLPGTGTVVLSSTGTEAINDATLTLTQDVEITTNGKLVAPVVAVPFAGGKTITITDTGVLDFGAGAATSIGATIVNEGKITTETLSVPVLNIIAALGGVIESAGAVAGNDNLVIPEGTTFEHKTGTFAGGSGTITIEGDATFTKGVLAGQTGAVTIAATGEATFAEATFAGLNSSLTVNGTMTADAATLIAVPTLTVAGELTVGDSATLAAVTTLTVNGKLTAGSALTLAAEGLTSANITGTGEIIAGAIDSAPAVKLIGSTVPKVTVGSSTIGAVTVPADTTRTIDGNTALSAAVTVNGELVLAGNTAIANAVTVSGEGGLALMTGKAITLSNATSSKIVGGSAYEITPESGETTGTLTAGGTEVAVIFTADSIQGWGANGSLALATADPATAATLTFGTKNSKLTIKAATTIAGVILDVATVGTIEVTDGFVLTLALGAGPNHIGSGGIFAKAVTEGGNATVVKANAAGVTASAGAFANAAALGTAKVVTTGAGNSDLTTTGEAAPAAGTVTANGAVVTIDNDDTFAVTANAITVSHS